MAKAIMAILTVLVILSVVYGCAKVGLIPVQQLAASSPIAAKILRVIKLTSPPPKHFALSLKRPARKRAAAKPQPPPPIPVVPAPQALPPKPAVLPAGPAASLTASTSGGASAAAAPVGAQTSSGAKLTAIYNTMDPDDIAKICTKLPDPVVIQTLSALDQKKAGKVLAAMDTARAAKITETMLATPPTPPGATPAVSVP